MGGLSVIERARKYMSAMPPAVSGAGGHDATFAVATALVRGFALSAEDALGLLREFNARCSPPWSERDLLYKIQSAERGSNKERGYLLKDAPAPRHDGGHGAPSSAGDSGGPVYQPAPKFEYDEERLRALAGDWASVVDLAWLANRSLVDPATVSPERFLEMIFEPGEKAIIFDNERSQGQAVWPVDPVPRSGPNGVWYLIQPVDGEEHPNPRTGKFSRRSEEAITRWPYMIIESDEAPVRLWLGAVVQLPLRVVAIYTSGGRSVHALVRIGARTKREWEESKAAMAPGLHLLGFLGADSRAMTSVRLSRLPGCTRRGALQKLLYINPAADLRPLRDQLCRRDVVQWWCERAAEPIADSDTTGGAWVKDGLAYYAPVSPLIRTAAGLWNMAHGGA